MILTQEQFERLSPYEAILLKAVDKKYINTNERKDLPALKKAYEDITGKKVGSMCSSCGGLKWLSRLGGWYIKHKLNTE